MNTSKKFGSLTTYWNQGLGQKALVLAISFATISLLFFCVVISVLIILPVGQNSTAKTISTATATATTQAVNEQDQSATATAFAIAHPIPTPSIFTSPTPSGNPSPNPTTSPLATLVPPPTTIPVTFVGLGGTTTAYENRFGNANECPSGVGSGCWITTIDGCSSDISTSVDGATLKATYQRIYQTDTQYYCNLSQYPNQDRTTQYCKTLIPSDSVFQQSIPTLSGYPAQQYISTSLGNTLSASDFTRSPIGPQNPPGTFYMEESTDGCTIATGGGFLY